MPACGQQGEADVADLKTSARTWGAAGAGEETAAATAAGGGTAAERRQWREPQNTGAPGLKL